MRPLLISIALMAALGVQAHAACPTTAGCPIMPQAGVQPCNAELAVMMERAARNRLFDGGPNYGNIGQGCANSVSVPASFPCVLVKAIAFAESTWRQFCSSECGQSGQTVISFDCGYGLTQVTSGMSGGSGFEPLCVALEPAYNLGSGMMILASKWRATPCVGDNQPLVLEHWYFATWAYNSFSWRNNPNNPDYPAGRPPYNGSDTLSRGSYPYQEIIWGLIRNPPYSSGQQLWAPIAVSYPATSEICSVADCKPAAAINSPQPAHTDPCQSAYVDSAELQFEQPSNPMTATAGQSLSKLWRLKNTGERTWQAGEGYSFVRVSPEAPGAPARIELAASCAHGAATDLSLQLTAPASGSASVTYELQRSGSAIGPQLVATVAVPSPGDADGDGSLAAVDCDDANAVVHPGAAERCDGEDQDCDGIADEELGRTCRNDCGEGEERCVDGNWGGCTAPTPADETCNGFDEDCDGQLDEDAPCPDDKICWEGQCVEDPVAIAPNEVTGGCGCGTRGGSPLDVLPARAAFVVLRPKRRLRPQMRTDSNSLSCRNG